MSGYPEIVVYADNNEVLKYLDTDPNQISSGFSGVGAASTSASAVISHVDLGYIDTIAPNAISSGSIGVSTFTNHVDLQWPATSDDANGTGVYDYEIWRNGVLMGSTTGTTYSDSAGIVPNTTYNYVLSALDYHLSTASTAFNATTPPVPYSGPLPSAIPEGRQVGVRSTGTYWGAGGENIDVRSGNVNYTLPLIGAKGRGSSGVNFNLTYNAQNWRQDSGGTWKFGGDVGYGFGWRLLAGSITPIVGDPYTGISDFLFTDSTGAEYRLDQNNGNVWSSKASLYIWFDANTNILHFRDGSFWYFGCVSASSEADGGTMYPTTLEDSNGNQVLVNYQQAPGAGWTNSSARITTVEDVRAVNPGSGYQTYAFTYNTDTPPHLTAISNTISTGEAYTLVYTSQTLYSPINSANYGTTAMLDHVTVNSTSTSNNFVYDSGGELTRVTLRYKGYMAYDYQTAQYPSSRSYREVVHRYLSKDGSTQTTYSFSHEGSITTDVHQYTKLDDPGGVGEKYWAFATSGTSEGLMTQYQGRQLPGPVVQTQNDVTWVQDAALNSYVATNLTTSDPGQSYQAQGETTQTVDTYGNVTQVNQYNYGNLSTPYRTTNYAYLNSSGYLSRYIYNRITSATETDGTNSVTLGSNSYDQTGLASVSGAREWDSSLQSVTQRGNVTSSSVPGMGRTAAYDVTGNVVSVTVNGVTTQVSTTSTTNYAAPSQITTGSFTNSQTFNSFLGLTNESGPNGFSVAFGFDTSARPSSVTSPFGAQTVVAYYDTATPPYSTTTVNGRWTKATKDGLGRTVLTETGNGTTTLSQAETGYDSCGCSPLGKMVKQAMPHAPGAGPAYTTYTYDGIGRTLTAVAADGASTTTYSYQGNTVTVTDPALKWKKYTTDVLGQLSQVNEPNPAGGSDYVSTYTYDLLGHLGGVSMARSTGTQTRTFNYGTPPGALLQSATNPENGTVSYTYNSYQKVATKTDAKGQQTQYTYDTYARLTQVRHYISGTEDTCQQVNYYYDSDFGAVFSSNVSGRLATVVYKGATGVYGSCDTTFTEMYNYNSAGARLGKRLRVARAGVTNTADLDGIYTYDNEGKMLTQQYPSWWNGSATQTGVTLTNTYDAMGRLTTLNDGSTNVISSATYGPAGELDQMTGTWGSESRSHNAMLQMTSLSSGSLSIAYNYSSTQNNGKIASQQDNVSGEQVTYTYDSLNRLATAQTADTTWGQSYAYDGFGNLTDTTTTKGTTPELHVNYSAATNRVSNEFADANGNIGNGSYDVENRLVAPTWINNTTRYAYGPDNKRVWRGVWEVGPGAQTVDEVTFWSVTGQRVGTYSLIPFSDSSTLRAQQTGAEYYFGGKLVKNAGGYVHADRLGSIGKYYPYGQERPSATANGTEKFGTYFRDSDTGLDYAVNRYEAPGQGRFLSSDPYQASGGPSDPGSWNRYSYVEGDPTNFNDRTGQEMSLVCGFFGEGDGDCGGGDDGGYSDEWCPLDANGFGPGSGQSCTVVQGDYAPRKIVPPPSCAQLEAQWIDQYLGSARTFNGIGNSPLISGLGGDAGQVLVSLGEKYNVDPALIIGIAAAESSLGTISGNGGKYNVYGNSAHFKGRPQYTNYVNPTNDVFTTIASYLAAGSNSSIASIYTTYEGESRKLPKSFQRQLKVIQDTDRALFGSAINVRFDCSSFRRDELAAALGLY